MKKVSKRISVTTASNFLIALLRLCKAYPALAENAYFKAQSDALEADSAALTFAIRQPKVLSTLDEADARRDDIITAIRALIVAAARLPAADAQAASAALQGLLANYQGITREPYADESALIASLLADFAKPEYAAHVTAVPALDGYVAALREAQDEFARASDAYRDAVNGRGENATTVKNRALTVVNEKVVPFVNVMAQTDSAAYGEFEKAASAEADRANATVAKSPAKKDGDA